jgi:alkylation response protein AidB-like acyl-CoA dehydrogenase
VTPTTLKNLRRALALNQTQMADAIGLEGEHAWRFLDDLETGKRPITGPIARVCAYLSQSADVADDPALSDGVRSLIPRFLDCSNLSDDEDGTEIVLHTQWPRFYALYPDIEWPDDLRAQMIAGGILMVPMPREIGGGDMVILWIDAPVDGETARRAVVECVRLKTAQARRDLA